MATTLTIGSGQILVSGGTPLLAENIVNFSQTGATTIRVDTNLTSGPVTLDLSSYSAYNGSAVPAIEIVLSDIGALVGEYKQIASFTETMSRNIATLAGKVGSVETPSMVVLSADVTIPAGAKMVTIQTGTAFSGTILTANAQADTVYTFIASAGNTLAAISVTRTAGDFTVLKVV